MAAITSSKHVLVTTFRRAGTAVASPVWVVPVSDGRVGMWTAAGTGKYKRLRHDPRLTVQACSARGKPHTDAPVLSGTAEIVQNGPLFDEVRATIKVPSTAPRSHWLRGSAA